MCSRIRVGNVPAPWRVPLPFQTWRYSELAGPRQPSNLETDRERDVLELMAQGLSNSQIGERLFLSRSGVSKHVANVFIKLGFDPTDDNRRVRAVLLWLRREGINRAPSKLLEPR